MTSSLKYVKSEKIWLKDRSEFDEAWLRDVITSDPTILGLGDVIVKDVERPQPKAGRLDLLLHDPEIEKRYEVEIMLGRVDESHIIRCLEYWDIERKRYPSYDHCAVLIAEDITTRFLNVISLFNSTLPIIALQMNAIKVNEQVVLGFVRVLDEVQAGSVQEDEELAERETADRSYWEIRGSALSLGIVDECLKLLKEIDNNLELSYKKHYMGLIHHNRPNNFLVFKAKKKFLRIEIRVADLDGLAAKFKESDLEVFRIYKRHGRVWFDLREGDVQSNREFLKQIFEQSFKESLE